MTELDQPAQQQPLQPEISDVSKPSRTSKKKKLIILIVSIAVILVFGVGAAAYNEIVVNNPDRIWDQAMVNTSEGFKSLSQQISQNPVNGGDVIGSINVTEPILASGDLKGSWYENNAKFNGDVSLSGIKLSGEIRVIGSADGVEPKATYVKINGLEGIMPLLNLLQPEILSVVSTINGNWYLIDDSLVTSAVPEAEDLQNLSFTPEELSNLSEKINNLLKGRLFSADESKSVIVAEKAIGREKFENSDTYKYAVKIQNQQLADFVKEFQEVLKGTKFENYLQNNAQAEGGTANSAQIDELLSQLNSLDTSTIRAEAWVDMDFKYFRNVRIPMNFEDTSITDYIDIGLNYGGGDIYPFYIKLYKSTYSQGDSSLISLEASLNKATKETDLRFSINSSSDSQNIVADGQLKLTPSDNLVEVEKPDGAKNASELLEILGQSSLLSADDYTGDNLFNAMTMDSVEL